MNLPPPIGIAINGLTGFAWVHHRAVYEAEKASQCRLLGYCDHQPSERGREVRRLYHLDKRGVPEFIDFAAMLGQLGPRCQLAFIPSPPIVHAHDHATAMNHGVACYLEKPPALVPTEFAIMLAAERRATCPTIVGFNHMADPLRWALKSRLVKGDFGKLNQVCVTGFWPRPDSYFRRASWPGRLMLGGDFVLDSVFGNAMSHFLHGMLFWGATSEVWAWTFAQKVEAELYRANAIESADTLFARGNSESGVGFRVVLSHACAQVIEPFERLECALANITVTEGAVKIEWTDGRTENLCGDGQDSHDRSIMRAIAQVRGSSGHGPSVSLADCESFVELNALFYVAGRAIHTVSPSFLSFRDGVTSINGIEEVGTQFITDGKFPAERGLRWAGTGGSCTRADRTQLETVIRRMSADASRFSMLAPKASS